MADDTWMGRLNKIPLLSVRWLRHKINRGDRGVTYRLIAQLVTEVVVGKDDETKVMVELGAIDEKFLYISIPRTRAFHQGLFWVKVDQVFNKLGLEADVQQALEGQIEEKVPRPPNDWALWGVTCIPQIDQ